MNDLWPNLSLISSWTSSSTELYLPQLKELYPMAKILPYMACGSEGIVAIPIDDQLKSAPLAINHGFYEFIPDSIEIKDVYKKQSETLLFNELEVGKSYHLIMSQGNGLLRYVTGDIYKVTGFYKEVPLIEFSSRAGTIFSFTGEKLTESQVLTAVKSLYEKFNLRNRLFIFTPIFSDPPYYELLIEANREEMIELPETFDYYLMLANEEYRTKRESRRLAPVKVIYLEEGTINKYIESQKKLGNGIQFKYKPFINDSKIISDIKNLL
jgi:hypothetical protein